MQTNTKLLQQIILNLPNYIFWKDINLLYQGCNKNFAQSLGFTHIEEVIGKSDEEMPWTESSAEIYREEDLQILSTGTPISNKVVSMKLANGDEKKLSVSKVALYDEAHIITGILGIYIDITELKKLESIKDDFISNMEHDLRTPMSGIGGVADLLKTVYASKYPELNQFFEMLTVSCKQWEQVHHRIFDALVSKQNLKIETFYIQDELEKIKAMQSATLYLKNLDFNINTPSREETGPITTDNLKFQLILLSLIGNAINFTEKGNVTINVRRAKNTFIIEVVDTGIGIPNDKLDYIFEKFAKLSRSNKYGGEFKGMGLGLYSAREDAVKLKGSVSVYSIVSKGSTFTLALPVNFN